MNNSNVIMTILLCVVVFIVGFVLGRMSYSEPIVDNAAQNIQGGIDSIGSALTPQNGTDDASATGEATVSTTNLSDGQRQLIETLGIDANSISITPEMIACAEAKLGAARVEEIKNGATPSFSEGVSLAACYR
jgi:hypothetical protein